MFVILLSLLAFHRFFRNPNKLLSFVKSLRHPGAKTDKQKQNIENGLTKFKT